MIQYAKYANCCPFGRTNIEWREADLIYGPVSTGWCIIDGCEDYGAAHSYLNISFCPICGTDVSSRKPE